MSIEIDTKILADLMPFMKNNMMNSKYYNSFYESKDVLACNSSIFPSTLIGIVVYTFHIQIYLVILPSPLLNYADSVVVPTHCHVLPKVKCRTESALNW